MVDFHVPIITETKATRRQYLPKPIKKMIKNRSTAWQKYCRYSSGKNFAYYKKLWNDVNRAIRRAEDSARNQIIKGFKGNPKRFFGYMRRTQTVKDFVIALKKDEGGLTTTDQETADLFSAYFSKVYTVEDTIHMHDVVNGHNHWKDDNLLFSEARVLEFWKDS